jgi:transcriptional regulator PpsR
MSEIISSASDIALIASPEGEVLSVLVNPGHRAAGTLDHWEGKNLRDLLTRESVPKFEARMAELAAGTLGAKAVELNHAEKGAAWEFPVRYSLHAMAPNGSVLFLGRDLRPIAEAQQQFVKAQLQLERDYERQREFDTRYRVLMEVAREALVFVDMTTGRIADVNGPAAALIGATRADLAGVAFAQEFEGRKRGEFLESLTANALGDLGTEVELTARRSKRKVFVAPTIFRAAGERMMLARLLPAEAADMVADELSENLAALYQEGADAIVFTDGEGAIRAANEAFLNLVDAAHVTVVKGKNLGAFMARGAIDMKVLLENTARAGHLRLYATRLSGAYGGQTAVEISATFLRDRLHSSYVFVIRDAGRAEAVRRQGGTVSDDAAKSVMDLVGASTLKDIVAETTDVVEKLCIETALELTRNNRVAAAEMLGLSRQSLYVKLRKFGLIGRDSEE